MGITGAFRCVVVTDLGRVWVLSVIHYGDCGTCSVILFIRYSGGIRCCCWWLFLTRGRWYLILFRVVILPRFVDACWLRLVPLPLFCSAVVPLPLIVVLIPTWPYISDYSIILIVVWYVVMENSHSTWVTPMQCLPDTVIDLCYLMTYSIGYFSFLREHCILLASYALQVGTLHSWVSVLLPGSTWWWSMGILGGGSGLCLPGNCVVVVHCSIAYVTISCSIRPVPLFPLLLVVTYRYTIYSITYLPTRIWLRYSSILLITFVTCHIVSTAISPLIYSTWALPAGGILPMPPYVTVMGEFAATTVVCCRWVRAAGRYHITTTLFWCLAGMMTFSTHWHLFYIVTFCYDVFWYSYGTIILVRCSSTDVFWYIAYSICWPLLLLYSVVEGVTPFCVPFIVGITILFYTLLHTFLPLFHSGWVPGGWAGVRCIGRACPVLGGLGDRWRWFPCYLLHCSFCYSHSACYFDSMEVCSVPFW